MPKFLKIRSLAAVLPLLVAAACAEAVKPVNGNNDDLFAPVNGGSGGGAGGGDAGGAGTSAGAAGESGAAGTSGSSGQSGSGAGTAGSAGASAGSAGAGAAAGNAGAGSAGKAGASNGGAAGTGGSGGADSPFGGGGTSGKAGSGASGGAGGDPNPFGGGGSSSGTCDHSPCDIGIPLDPTCDSCASIVCSDDPFCCDVDWDDVCAGSAIDLCNNCSGSGGSGGGPAACAHDPCTSGAALTKGCDACVTAVCASDSFCCKTAWDSYCVEQATSACGTTCQ